MGSDPAAIRDIIAWCKATAEAIDRDESLAAKGPEYARELRRRLREVGLGRLTGAIHPFFWKNARRCIDFLSDWAERRLPPLLAENQDEFEHLCVFRRDGEFWVLTFEGKTVRVKNLIGLHHIARLLSQPNRTLPATLLVALHAGLDSRTISGSSGPLIDDESRRDYESRYREIVDELEEARVNNDLSRVEKLQGDLHQVGNELTRALGLQGRIRQNSTQERARKSVSMAVNRAIEEIEAQHVALHHHLAAFITLGSECGYAPDRSIDWLT